MAPTFTSLAGDSIDVNEIGHRQETANPSPFQWFDKLADT